MNKLTSIVLATTLAAGCNGDSSITGEIRRLDYSKEAIITYRDNTDEERTLMIYDLDGDDRVDEAFQISSNSSISVNLSDFRVFGGIDIKYFKHFVMPDIKKPLIKNGITQMTSEQQKQYDAILNSF